MNKSRGSPSLYQKTYCVHENVCADLPIDCRPPLDFSLGGTKGGQKLMTVPLVRAMFERNSIPALHKTLETMHNQEHLSRDRVYKTIIDDARKISKNGGGGGGRRRGHGLAPPAPRVPVFTAVETDPRKSLCHQVQSVLVVLGGNVRVSVGVVVVRHEAGHGRVG